jgi:hypothetical protein
MATVAYRKQEFFRSHWHRLSGRYQKGFSDREQIGPG